MTRGFMLTALTMLLAATYLSAQTLKFDELEFSSNGNVYFFDSYKVFDDRLSRFIQQLKLEKPGAGVYLIHYRSRISESRYSAAEQLASRARWEIGYRTKIKDDNIHVVDGGILDNETVEFWIARKGAAAPKPTPRYSDQQGVNCPSILLNSQGFQFNDQQPATFAVELSPKMESRFEWAVGSGRITKGQGTSEIDVDVQGLKSVEVRVTALDLPIECNRDKIIRAEIGPRPVLLDEYGRIPESDIRSRLDSFLTALSNNPFLTGYLVIYGARSMPNSPAAIERLLRNHFAFRNFDVSRIVIVRGGFREDLLTRIWLVHPGGPLPDVRPSVDDRFVKRPLQLRRSVPKAKRASGTHR